MRAIRCVYEKQIAARSLCDALVKRKKKTPDVPKCTLRKVRGRREEEAMPRKCMTIKSVVNYVRSSRMHVANALYARDAFCSNAS